MEGFLLALLTPLFWGSWPVPMKFARRRQVSDGGASFSVFYYLFTGMISLSLICSAFVLGGIQMFKVFTMQRALLAMTAGLSWQTGNMLLAIATQIAGPAFAFCASGCISVTLGTCLTYWIQPEGDVLWLLGGVVCALAAVLIIFEMHRVKDGALKSYNRQLLVQGKNVSDGQQTGSLPFLRRSTIPEIPVLPTAAEAPGMEASQNSNGSRKNVVFVIVFCSGCCVGMYNPVNTLAVMPLPGASDDAEMLLHHGILWLGVGVFLGAQLTLPIIRKLKPEFFRAQRQNEQCDDNASICKEVIAEFLQTSRSAAFFSLSAGVCWACGFVANMIGGRYVGFALSFALSQTCPLVASFWGLVIFGEFSGPWVPLRAKILLGVELLLYVASMGCLLMCRLAE